MHNYNEKKVVAIIQARTGSSRLPNKVLANIGDTHMICMMLNRVQQASLIDELWVATSELPEDDVLETVLLEHGYNCYRGSEKDVLKRYSDLALIRNADIVVRLTGDCPLIDPKLIDYAIENFLNFEVDYLSNTLVRRFPDGQDVEVFSFKALEEANNNAENASDREHVTPYIHGQRSDLSVSGSFKKHSIEIEEDWSHIRLTVDYPEDLEFIRELNSLIEPHYGWRQIVAVLSKHNHLNKINAEFVEQGDNKRYRAEMKFGAPSFDKSNIAFEKACKIIPGASQTFSKSASQWVQGATPLFLDSGKGALVYDIDGNSYIDYVLGLLPVSLGYCDTEVNEAIREQLLKGITFSLPTLLEEELASLFVRDIPCSEMVRFAKTGSDATSAAIRLARAFTGRDHVVAIGYHGWHDWYVGSTTRNLGVPKEVRKLTHSLPFNDGDLLEEFCKKNGNQLAAIILEPDGATPTATGYLEKVKEIAEKYGAVLIFDEVVTGFRVAQGGAQEFYGVVPDLACFGKSMANGMPISAITGRADIMKLMLDVFVSGTFGGEALSLVAAIATIEKLKKHEVPRKLRNLGNDLIKSSNETFKQAGLEQVLHFQGNDWFPRLKLKDHLENEILVNSLIRQEMVRENLLLAASFNMCFAHCEQSIISQTKSRLVRVAEALFDHLNAPDPSSRLLGEQIQATFSVRK